MHVKIAGIILESSIHVAQTRVIRYYLRFEIANLLNPIDFIGNKSIVTKDRDREEPLLRRFPYPYHLSLFKVLA